MSANYEWQKREADYRLAARRQEAERHWLAKAARGEEPRFKVRLSVLFQAFRRVLVGRWRSKDHVPAKAALELGPRE